LKTPTPNPLIITYYNIIRIIGGVQSTTHAYLLLPPRELWWSLELPSVPRTNEGLNKPFFFYSSIFYPPLREIHSYGRGTAHQSVRTTRRRLRVTTTPLPQQSPGPGVNKATGENRPGRMTAQAPFYAQPPTPPPPNHNTPPPAFKAFVH